MITPGNHAWHAADIAPRPFSLAMAGEQLDRIGVRDRNGDGVREDVYNAPATFTLLVQQGHTVRQRAAVVLQEALAKVGLSVEIASLDARGLQERMAEGHLRRDIPRAAGLGHRPVRPDGVLAVLGTLPPLESRPSRRPAPNGSRNSTC